MTDELPEGWSRAILTEVAEVRLGRQRSPSNHQGTHMRPYLRAANVSWGGLKLVDIKEMNFELAESAVFELLPGDVLIVEASGSPNEVGKAAIWRGEISGCCFQNTLLRVRSHGILPEYLLHLLYFHATSGDFGRAARGVGIHHLGARGLSAWPIVVPPLHEQGMIVAAVEEQLSRLDDAVRLVETALRKLPLIRRAVLSEVMPDPLPAGWKLLTVEEAGTVELGRQRSPRYHSGPNMKPYLRVANVHEDRIDLSDVKEMDFPPGQLARHELRSGDILLNEGQSPEFVGRPAMYRDELPGACFTNSLIRFRPFDFVDGEYALLVFLRHLRFGRFQREAQITTNIAHMAAGRFKRVEFPVPPLDEQHDIVEAARRRLSLLDALGTSLRTALRRSDTLRRAILAAAFRGELVSQDPTDEPAADLLARIESAWPLPTRRTRKRNGA